MYEGVDTDPPGAQEYNTVDGVHGGKALTVSGAANGTCTGNFGAAIAVSARIFNEQGEQVGTGPSTAAASPFTQGLEDPYEWIEVADILKRFSGINNLLLTILPVISIAGFLGVSGAKLYTYGKGNGFQHRISPEHVHLHPYGHRHSVGDSWAVYRKSGGG